MKAGEAIDYRFQVPVTMEIQEDSSPVAKSTNNANVRQSYIVTCRLFGIFPVKDIEVVLVDGDAVYAGRDADRHLCEDKRCPRDRYQ